MARLSGMGVRFKPDPVSGPITDVAPATGSMPGLLANASFVSLSVNLAAQGLSRPPSRRMRRASIQRLRKTISQVSIFSKDFPKFVVNLTFGVQPGLA